MKAGALRMHDYAKEAVNRSIMIVGVARSGTTLAGHLINSFTDIEYSYEPPMLFSLLPIIDRIPADDFKLLLETYVYEELLTELVTGRGINTNRNDDSCIYKTKTEADIQTRLKTAWSKSASIPVAAKRRLAFKMTDTTSCLSKLQAWYPGMRIVLVHRHANAVIDSVVRKGWYSDESLSRPGILWPSVRAQGADFPSWIPQDRYGDWRKWSEAERAAFYFITILENIPKVSNPIWLSYDSLVEDPRGEVARLAASLGATFGPLTEGLIGGIRPSRQAVKDWTAGLNGELKTKALSLSDLDAFKKLKS